MQLTNSTSLITRDNIQIVHIDNSYAKAEISLFGGHILSFEPKHDSRERLWVSKSAIFDGKKALRGGVPICWPWFGDHNSNPNVSAHGYVRTQKWEIISTQDSDTGTTITLQPAICSGDGFDGRAQLNLIVNISKQLNIQLCTTNIGDSAFTYNGALHTYFAITDIHQCELLGLSGQYSDKTRDYQLFNTPAPYFFNEETDRVHQQQSKLVTIKNVSNQTDVYSSGHDSIVVWNPWQEKSANMADMADDSYLTMVCVETAITQGQSVNPGETHILEQAIS